MIKRTAIVTGSEGEIGQAICSSLKADGFEIIGIDVTPPRNQHLYLYFFQESVASSDLVGRAFRRIEDWNPEELVLINNAGVTFPNDSSIDSWNKTLEINLTAPYLWMERCSEFFEKHGIPGSIVSITSLAAEFSFPGNPSYAASKGGLRQLTKSYARRLGILGISCNNIAPGYIETKFNSKSLSDKEMYENRAQHSLMHRWGKPTEIAESVSFLCSKKASFITGQDFFVDGGWSAQGLIEYE